ncbi:hypothetical protein RJD24_14665 [Bacillaceae bacterium IKA-2]|nr:hypothetical protein RJD24_14665 [Bacillaceae bacterium IKA-2]
MDIQKQVLNEICERVGLTTYWSYKSYYNQHSIDCAKGEINAYTDVLLKLNGKDDIEESEGQDFVYSLMSIHVKNGYRTGYEHIDDAMVREFITKDFKDVIQETLRI